MTDKNLKDDSDPTNISYYINAPEEFNVLEVISDELTHVPYQLEPVHKEAISPDVEGFEPFNSLPDVALSGTHSEKYEDEDGIRRSGKHLNIRLENNEIGSTLFRL